MAPFNWTSLQNLLAGSRPKSVNWASSPPINNSYEIGFYQPYFIIQYKSNFDPYKRCLLLKLETSLYIELLNFQYFRVCCIIGSKCSRSRKHGNRCPYYSQELTKKIKKMHDDRYHLAPCYSINHHSLDP
uniref:Uncharacterized protein n=1 Tax=Lactuca sativa TaxID=4236 RepID=A0A9R1UVX1_LACSA|nr:hypothetical protein LSAT_V11C800441170 [Lactuca sativa]